MSSTLKLKSLEVITYKLEKDYYNYVITVPLRGKRSEEFK